MDLIEDILFAWTSFKHLCIVKLIVMVPNFIIFLRKILNVFFWIFFDESL